MLTGIGSAANIATVHGVAYEWSTFEPLDNAIVEVNSTPAQSMVAQYGVYSFELANGTYQITASYYEDDQLTYYAEDVITVSEEGSYVLDLLLVPSYSSSTDAESSDANSNSLLYGSILLIIVLLVLILTQMKQKPQTQKHAARKEEVHHAVPDVPEKVEERPARLKEKSAVTEPEPAIPLYVAQESEQETVEMEEPIPDQEELVEIEEPDKSVPVIKSETVAKEPEPVQASVPEPVLSDEPVPADLQEILDILASQGGRMTQKDMRKRLKYSEGKVSLMLLDLEKRGKIQKFKKGRGNVLFLVESEK